MARVIFIYFGEADQMSSGQNSLTMIHNHYHEIADS